MSTIGRSLVGNHTMKTLRAAGIPVEGAMTITGMSDGELNVRADDGDLVYTWRGEAPLVVEEEGIW